MITPVNGHLLIEPLEHKQFMETGQQTFEEIGTIVGLPESLLGEVKLGDSVYFDSWLAARYPKSENEFYWLVKWEDVRAVEHA